MIVCAMTKGATTKLKFFLWEALDKTFVDTSSSSLQETWSDTPTGFPTVTVSGIFKGMDSISNTLALGADATWLVAVASTVIDGSKSGVYAFGGTMGTATLIAAADTSTSYSAQFFQKAGILYVAFGTATGIDGKSAGFRVYFYMHTVYFCWDYARYA